MRFQPLKSLVAALTGVAGLVHLLSHVSRTDGAHARQRAHRAVQFAAPSQWVLIVSATVSEAEKFEDFGIHRFEAVELLSNGVGLRRVVVFVVVRWIRREGG